MRLCGPIARIADVTAPRSRAEQKRHTRALIVDAGRRAVASRGFSSLAVRELAREAGIVPTAFYRHFESVDDLAAEDRKSTRLNSSHGEQSRMPSSA